MQTSILLGFLRLLFKELRKNFILKEKTQFQIRDHVNKRCSLSFSLFCVSSVQILVLFSLNLPAKNESIQWTYKQRKRVCKEEIYVCFESRRIQIFIHIFRIIQFDNSQLFNSRLFVPKYHNHSLNGALLRIDIFIFRRYKLITAENSFYVCGVRFGFEIDEKHCFHVKITYLHF